MAATSFPLFMYLPFELRARMWELAAEPRLVDVDFLFRETTRTDYEADDYRVLEKYVVSLTPSPAIVQVCRETRQLGVYRQLFSELEDVRDGGERRYVWLNLELDIIDRGAFPLESFIPIAVSIQRLKVTRILLEAEEMIFLGQCVNLKELVIDAIGYVKPNWYRIFTRFPLACGLENILTVDPLFGLVSLRPEYIEQDIEQQYRTTRMISIVESHLSSHGIQWGQWNLL
ncbi:hypothetical protein QBC32DRAFT_385126 [Pseudoneurospora amorphoporcata]|uniref:2EXR domain-containing protein n=1 Tax=Pseudoneurospora amorphoporcata TaxID=241081 RepID=A0AAN6NLC5_9PEZI|nr:hypothetical protein QBC32DRAFT_385126 [Pseudoneurospora amorphoporcata]